MFKNYLKIAFRSLWRNKVFAMINITALSLGMVGAFLLFLWVSYTASFDRFHQKIDRIYHVFANMHVPSTIETWWSLPYPAAQKIKEEVPEVEELVLYSDDIWLRLNIGQASFYEHGIYATPSFLSVFSFPLMYGSAQTALNSPTNILITQKLALKYFPDFKDDLKSVIGKSIRINNEKSFVITGILNNTPRNCTIVFDFIMPLQTMLNEFQFL